MHEYLCEKLRFGPPRPFAFRSIAISLVFYCTCFFLMKTSSHNKLSMAQQDVVRMHREKERLEAKVRKEAMDQRKLAERQKKREEMRMKKEEAEREKKERKERKDCDKRKKLEEQQFVNQLLLHACVSDTVCEQPSPTD